VYVAAVLAGVAGALLTVVVLALTGVFNRSTPSAPAASKPTISAPSALSQAVTVGLSMVAINARDNSGSRSGAGVCVRHGTEVLTSADLIGNARVIDVVTPDGQRHAARVVGKDRTTDLALLSINTTIPAARLADHLPSAGAPVWIVGARAAGGSMPWMSTGVLSSADAVVTVASGPWTGGLLETDAAGGGAAPGSALVDESGAVAGIVIGSFDSEDTTYAVPIDAADDVGEQIHTTGVAEHGSFGFTGANLVGGLTVTAVVAHGPAAAAGLRYGDVVDSVNGYDVETMDDVMAALGITNPGETITIALRRGKTSFKVQLKTTAVKG
jgi:S1-C subfamily serine protease